MARYTTENIHAVALVGHGGAGKTMLAEALLWKAGVIGAMGSTERGTTVCDFDPLEKQYGHSLSSSLVNFPDRKSTRLNSSHSQISYAVFCLKKKKKKINKSNKRN